MPSQEECCSQNFLNAGPVRDALMSHRCQRPPKSEIWVNYTGDISFDVYFLLIFIDQFILTPFPLSCLLLCSAMIVEHIAHLNSRRIVLASQSPRRSVLVRASPL